jgi:LuxR family maltose regulon positive regulatory protein
MNHLDPRNTYRLILIVAPEKSGKTEYVRDWARRQSKDQGIRVAWLTLEEADNQPERFLTSLDRALHAVIPLTLAQPDQSIGIFSARTTGLPGDQALVDALTERINALAQSPGKLVLVLDNYEAITSSEVHQMVGMLLDYLPHQALVVIASTCEPPLPLARLRVRRQLLELSVADLEL